MMNSEHNEQDPKMRALTRLLSEAGNEQAIELDEAVMARVLADAYAHQPVAGTMQGNSFVAQLKAALGGWQGLGGLAAASCVGFWIGVNPPDVLNEQLDLASIFVSNSEVIDNEVDDNFGWAALEG